MWIIITNKIKSKGDQCYKLRVCYLWVGGEAFEDEMEVSVAIEIACLGVEEADEVLQGEGVVVLLKEEEVFQ